MDSCWKPTRATRISVKGFALLAVALTLVDIGFAVGFGRLGGTISLPLCTGSRALPFRALAFTGVGFVEMQRLCREFGTAGQFSSSLLFLWKMNAAFWVGAILSGLHVIEFSRGNFDALTYVLGRERRAGRTTFDKVFGQFGVIATLSILAWTMVIWAFRSEVIGGIAPSRIPQFLIQDTLSLGVTGLMFNLIPTFYVFVFHARALERFILEFNEAARQETLRQFRQ